MKLILFFFLFLEQITCDIMEFLESFSSTLEIFGKHIFCLYPVKAVLKVKTDLAFLRFFPAPVAGIHKGTESVRLEAGCPTLGGNVKFQRLVAPSSEFTTCFHSFRFFALSVLSHENEQISEKPQCNGARNSIYLRQKQICEV